MAPGKPRVDLIELGLQDEWLHAVTYVEVGPQGERVDKRDYVSHWEETIRSAAMEDPIIRKVRDGDLLTPEEETSPSGSTGRRTTSMKTTFGGRTGSPGET